MISTAARRRPTIADVARVAGVSKSTVSRVLNSKPDVDPATVAAIHEVMNRLGYVPSQQAVGLARGNAANLGLLTPSISSPWMLEVLRGVSEVVESTPFSLTLYTTNRGRDSLDAVLSRLHSHSIDGLAIMQPPWDAEEIRRVMTLDTPIVAIDDRGAHPSLTSVAGADDEGIRAVVDHLVSLGRHRLGMLAGPAAVPCHRDRARTFESAVRAAGLQVDPDWLIAATDDTFTAGAAAAAELLHRGFRADALVVGNDALALGASGVFRRAGRVIPDDVAVTGFDDIAAARYSDPPLTTVYNPLYEMGRTAAEILLAAIRGDGVPNSPVLLPTTLVVRGSTDPAAPAPAEDLLHWRTDLHP